MKYFIIIITFIITKVSFGQNLKYKIDCDSVLVSSKNIDIHSPTTNFNFMSAVDLKNPIDWKNQDTLNLSTFTINNLEDKVPIIIVNSKNQNNNIKGEIVFSQLVYFQEKKEYGPNSDYSYYTDFYLSKGILVLQEKNWWSKGKGKKYKYSFEKDGINCMKLIRLNPNKQKMFPKPIRKKDKYKLGKVSNY
ncbi:MAG: hypothetical protein H6586_05665 [Flavobacteriales bacterium]|nr:hypothetical protein [Flavobacteriales bacterium]